MTSSEASSFAGDLSEKSKHWENYVRRQEWMMTLRKRSKHFANYLYQPMGTGVSLCQCGGKEQCASDAEDLFSEWLMGGRNG